MKAFFKGKAVVEIARDEDGIFTPNDFMSWVRIHRKVVAPRLLNTCNDFKSLLMILEELRTLEHDVKVFYRYSGPNHNKMYSKGAVALFPERGLCAYVDSKGWNEFRALKFVNQRLLSKDIIKDHIYPVDGAYEYHRKRVDGVSLWRNPMRWVYIDHVINETKLIISELDK